MKRMSGSFATVTAKASRIFMPAEYVASGASKFILRPMCPPDRMLDQLGQLATDVIPEFHRR